MPPYLFLVAVCIIPSVVSLLITDSEDDAVFQLINGSEEVYQGISSFTGPQNRSNNQFGCSICSTLMQSIKQLLSANEEQEKINDFLKTTCVSLQIQQPNVCNGIIDQYAASLHFPLALNVIYFVIQRVDVTPEEVCGMFLDGCGASINLLKVPWNLSIPGGKPPVRAWPKVNVRKQSQRVLHISDIHIDREYAEGSESDCIANKKRDGIGLCCRKTVYNRTSSSIKKPAGKWGSLATCDLPYRTFDAAIRHISRTHKDLDYIMITGDMEAHDVWDYTREKTKANIANITQVLANYFPSTPIYQAIGNHEGVPSDAMAPHNMDEYAARGPAWIYNFLSRAWSRWISPDAVKGVQYRASYVEYPSPGLKLISLNSIYCSYLNFYIYINQTDPDGTLTWLISQLLDSEAKGEKVHIISHIPPGDNYCLKGWAHNFYEIVNRFENTITAQFYGHTHNDHFQVYYEDSNPSGRPTHFNFITPSLTTYSYNNPAYRIYSIDGGYKGASYTVLDAETYTTDLDKANSMRQEPKWFLEYSTKREYGLSDLSPSSWSSLIDRLAVDDGLFRKYHRFFYRSSYASNCVTVPSCRQRHICSLRVAKSFERNHFCAGVPSL